MNKGYIKLYRKVTNSFVWTNPQMLKLWVLCLMKASHKDNRFLFNGEEITVSSGQFVTGRDALAKEFNEGTKSDQRVVARTLWRWIKKFEKEEMLSIESNTKYSVISIKNWSEYQQSDQHVSNDCPSTVQRLSTNKNEKNEKNEKKSSRKSKIYDESSVEYQLAKRLFDRIRENFPEHKEPNLHQWADVIRLMIERDERKPEKIAGMIDWCQRDDFWRSNILSTRSLRDKYDTMNAQAARKVNRGSSGTKPNDFSLDDLLNEGE